MIIGISGNENKSTQESMLNTQEPHSSTQQTTAERIMEEIRMHTFTTRE